MARATTNLAPGITFAIAAVIGYVFFCDPFVERKVRPSTLRFFLTPGPRLNKFFHHGPICFVGQDSSPVSSRTAHLDRTMMTPPVAAQILTSSRLLIRLV
jgi:hypothetical protein